MPLIVIVSFAISIKQNPLRPAWNHCLSGMASEPRCPWTPLTPSSRCTGLPVLSASVPWLLAGTPGLQGFTLALPAPSLPCRLLPGQTLLPLRGVPRGRAAEAQPLRHSLQRVSLRGRGLGEMDGHGEDGEGMYPEGQHRQWSSVPALLAVLGPWMHSFPHHTRKLPIPDPFTPTSSSLK